MNVKKRSKQLTILFIFSALFLFTAFYSLQGLFFSDALLKTLGTYSVYTNARAYQFALELTSMLFAVGIVYFICHYLSPGKKAASNHLNDVVVLAFWRFAVGLAVLSMLLDFIMIFMKDEALSFDIIMNFLVPAIGCVLFFGTILKNRPNTSELSKLPAKKKIWTSVCFAIVVVVCVLSIYNAITLIHYGDLFDGIPYIHSSWLSYMFEPGQVFNAHLSSAPIAFASRFLYYPAVYLTDLIFNPELPLHDLVAAFFDYLFPCFLFGVGCFYLAKHTDRKA